MPVEETPAPARNREAAETPKQETPDYLKDHVMVELEVPFKISGVLATSIRLRRPKLKDRRALAKMASENNANPLEMELQLIARLSDNSPDDLQEMDDLDYRKVCDASQSFLPPRYRTLTQ